SSRDGFGTYGYEDNGAKYRYVIPAPENHVFIERIEDHRRNTGAANIYYVLATLDNLKGEEFASIPDLSIVTQDGETISFRPAWTIFGDWQRVNAGTAKLNEGVYLYNEAITFGNALPGAKTEDVLAAVMPVASIRNVFVIPPPDLLGALQALESGKADNLERTLEQSKPIKLDKLN
ncbi:MAG: hypothetical protein IH861_07315, partial [Chloroflexi bacterium]|nr:hypothetical protein [Chloroflexota bacterium]